MYSALYKNSLKTKEYRYNEVASGFIGSTSKVKRDFLPKPPQLNAPEPPSMPGSRRTNGVAYNYFDISPVIPAYVGLLGYDAFTAFVQRYYDWLYTSNPGANDNYGSGYFLITEDLFKLTDIDKIVKNDENDEEFIPNEETRRTLLELIVSEYADGFDGVFSDYGEAELTNFVKDIRSEFYIKKGTKDSLKYYFSKLYGPGYVPHIDEPKKYILRTDGGVPEFANLERTSRKTLVTEPSLGLNELVLQDSYWYQDYSYLLNVEGLLGSFEMNDDQQTAYLNLAHPTGMKVFFNVTNEDYIPPEDFDGEFGAREQTIIGNYHPYRLSDTTSLPATAGCTFDLEGDDVTHPAFAHPGWSSEIVANQIIGNINIGSFFFLFPADSSPNTGLSASFDPDESPCDSGD